MLKISDNYTDKSVGDIIKATFGNKADEIINIFNECFNKNPDEVAMEKCVKEKLKAAGYKLWEEQSVWGFLSHFVIVG